MSNVRCAALVVLLGVSIPSRASAEPASAEPAHAERAHSVYAELFGKAGLWGLGFDRRISRRITLGAVGSVYGHDGQRYFALSPYLGFYLVQRSRHAWFADAGPLFVHSWASSPIPEWSGDSSTGVGAEVASGYEYRGELLVRFFVQAVIGKGGVLPWAGLGVGWAF